MMRLRIFALLLLILSVRDTAQAQDTRPSEAGLQCYFGTLHAHCVLSGDFEPQADRQALANLLASSGADRFTLADGPNAAWEHAATVGKIDFVALTDHFHATSAGADQDGMPDGGYELLKAAADRINNDVRFQGKFLAIPGMEWSTISRGNHINILFARKPVPKITGNGRFVALLNRYLSSPDFEQGNTSLLVQMNRPNQNGATLGAVPACPTRPGPPEACCKRRPPRTRLICRPACARCQDEASRPLARVE